MFEVVTRPIQFFILIVVVSTLSYAEDPYPRSTLVDNGISRTISHMYSQCQKSDDIFRCLKIQGAKLAGRALKVHNIKLLEGVSIVRKADYNDSEARSRGDLHLSNSDLEHVSSKSLDRILLARLLNLFHSRQVQVNIPKLISLGRHTSYVLFGESRKKKDDKKYLVPFISAVLLKAGILKMAYHSIAILAGKALIVGKIALIISAIIGLKKLVSGEGHEKTTYEIVKHPQIQQSHTYSSSHGEYDSGGHESGAYHRSIDDEMIMQDKAYSAHVPRT